MNNGEMPEFPELDLEAEAPDEPDDSAEYDRDWMIVCSQMTDAGNADLVRGRADGAFRYVTGWNKWAWWDGKRWSDVGGEQRLGQFVKEVLARAWYDAQRDVAAARAELATIPRADKESLIEAKAALAKCIKVEEWYHKSQNVGRVAACEKLLEDTMAVDASAFDSSPDILNVGNGAIRLTDGSIIPHRKDLAQLRITNVHFDPEAECPTWDAFIRKAMGGNEDMVAYLQRLIGYAITGHTTEHLLAFFYGGGRNGKSTFLQTIRSVMQEHACAAPRNMLFEDKSGNRHPCELAVLHGKRIAICAEIGEGITLDEAKVKDLTGGDTISVRRMREDFWDMTPTHTLLIAGNHKPTVKGCDLGIWRRIRLIPWEVTISDEEVDKDLPQKLASEAEGILRWCVEGCLEWRRIGLAEPQAVLDMTNEYRQESDTLGEFFRFHCKFDPDGRISNRALREKYEEWCKESGTYPLGARTIDRYLTERKCVKVPVRDQGAARRGWAGVRLLTSYEQPGEPDSLTKLS